MFGVGVVGASLRWVEVEVPDDGSSYTTVTRDLDVPETAFTGPDLTTFLGLDALVLTTVGQLLTAERAVVECRIPVGFEDPFCKACGAQGQARGTVTRRLAQRAGGVESHAAAGTRAALRLHPLPPSVEAGHERPG